MSHTSNEGLCDLQVVVECREVESREPVVLWLVDGAGGGQVGQDEPHGTHVPPQGCMVQAVEAVAVGEGDVHLCLQQELDHVVSLLRDGVVEGCVTISILDKGRRCSTFNLHPRMEDISLLQMPTGGPSQ